MVNLFGEEIQPNKKEKVEVKKVIPKKRTDIKPSESLLKSNLQKAVRRNQELIAVKSAKSLLLIDEQQFLRRWLVIILEDGILYPKFGEIATWLKNWRASNLLTIEQKDILINSVGQVAGSEIRDNWVDEEKEYLDNEEEVEAIKFGKQNDYEDVINTLPKELVEILQGIKYRSVIGGLKGDIVMLQNYYYLWLKRFLKKEWDMEKLESCFKKTNYKFEEMKMAEKKDILLVGADFHCTPLLKILLKKDYVRRLAYQYYSPLENPDLEKLLKGILWRQMSSVNYKREIGVGEFRDWYRFGSGKNFNKEFDNKIYNGLKAEIESISRWFIKKQYEE